MMGLLRLAAFLHITLSSAESCRFSYTRQPVRELHCLPTNQSLELVCEIWGPRDTNFKLLWQIQDSSGSRTEDNGTTSITMQDDRRIARTTLGLDVVAMLTEVYCEVHVEGVAMPVVSDILNLRNVSMLPDCNSSTFSLVNEVSDCIEVPLPAITSSVPPSKDLSRQVLYGVAAVVVVFAMLIVFLSVGVVFLLRRKCAKKPAKGLSRQDCEEKDLVANHPGFSNRLNMEKKNLSVTFSDSIDGSKVPSLPSLLSGHVQKTCPSMPCPPTPDETTKLDLTEPASHFLDIYRTLREGGQDVGEAGSEQDEEGVEKATPPSVTWASPLHAGVCNPSYSLSFQPHVQECDIAGPDIADSAYVRSRYEWNEPAVDMATGRDQEARDKYRGNYERDPLYMARQKHTYTNYVPENSALPCVSPQTAHAQTERTDKYRGNYERSETYVFPPVTASSATPLSVTPRSHDQSHSQQSELFDGVLQAGIGTGKYRGSYERSHIYVQHLLKTEVSLPSNHTEHVQLMHTNSS